MVLGQTAPDISICVAVYRRHPEPNLTTLVESLPLALGPLTGELVVALNGISAADAGVPEGAATVAFERNRGVPVAWNAAARIARAPVVCVINDDVVLGRDALVLLHRALASEPSAGVVGPVGTSWDIARAQHTSYLSLEGLSPGEARECEVVSGFLMATPKSVFEAVGGFDEAYSPCGWEEVDYCTAVRMKARLRCLAVAGVQVTHDFAISAARPWRRIRYDGRSESLGSISRRNRRHFLLKWSGVGGKRSPQAAAAGSATDDAHPPRRPEAGPRGPGRREP